MMLSVSDRGIDPRLERLPLMPWHWRAVGIIGIALSAEVVDSLALSFALPVLMERWALSPVAAGLLVSLTYAGQMLGALMGGWLSDRKGRLNLLRWSTAAVIALGLLVGWSDTYGLFLIFRAFQGLAMGSVLVLTIAYISEIAATRFRGRLIFGLNIINTVAAASAASIASQIIPVLGVSWIFYIGALTSIPFFVLSWTIPESPRWLALNGRTTEADNIVSVLEDRAGGKGSVLLPDPPLLSGEQKGPARWRELLSHDLGRMTICLWAMSVSSGTLSVSLISWLPTLFLKAYRISVQSALSVSSVSYLAMVLAAVGGLLFIDRISRKGSLMLGFSGLALTLSLICVFFGAVPLALAGGLAFLTVLANMFVLQTVSLVSAEIYPTSLRGTGAGAVRFWMSVSAIIAPLAVGVIMAHFSPVGVLLFMLCVALVGLTVATTSARLWADDRAAPLAG